jgi:[calcium/calmodulin-dependent protein kinase] kinase
MAPEALDKDAAKKGFSGIKADIWSLGVTFYAFIYLTLPYFSANIYKIAEVINNNE